MAFQQFAFPQVLHDLELNLTNADLFGSVAADEVRPELLAVVLDGANLASSIDTEKARSEFVIAPVLLELRRRHGARFGLFSGVELNADPNIGLNGICDFLITRSPTQLLVTSPILAVVEAKNDNIRTGLGQCIASMIAIQMLNRAANEDSSTVYGAVTTGILWKFLQCTGSNLAIDFVEYQIKDLSKIMGILSSIVRS